MPNITLAIPNELHKKLRKYSEIRWSQVIKKMLEKRLEDLETMEKLTKKDVDEIGDLIKKGIAKRHGLI